MQNEILAMIIYPYRKVPVFQPIKISDFKDIVGEELEKVDINNKFAVICGRNAAKNGKDRNLTIIATGENIYGNCVICKTEGEGLESLSFQETYEADKLYIRW